MSAISSLLIGNPSAALDWANRFAGAMPKMRLEIIGSPIIVGFKMVLDTYLQLGQFESAKNLMLSVRPWARMFPFGKSVAAKYWNKVLKKEKLQLGSQAPENVDYDSATPHANSADSTNSQQWKSALEWIREKENTADLRFDCVIHENAAATNEEHPLEGLMQERQQRQGNNSCSSLGPLRNHRNNNDNDNNYKASRAAALLQQSEILTLRDLDNFGFFESSEENLHVYIDVAPQGQGQQPEEEEAMSHLHHQPPLPFNVCSLSSLEQFLHI